MPDFGRWTPGGGDPSLEEIARADRFFDALASNQPVYSTDREEAELAFLLSGWRDDVREAPVTVPVSTGAAIDALEAGLPKNADRGTRRPFAIIGSVAAAVLCIGGFGTAIYGAGPGDSLYGMRTAMFGQPEVTRDEQVSLASAQLAQVQQLIDNGQWQEAQDKLVAVSTAVQGVGPVDQKQQLVEQWNALTYKVVEQNPAATLPPPGEPLPPLPSSPLTWLPIPVVDGTTSSPATTTVSTSDTSTSETSSTSPSDSTSPSASTSTSPSTSPSSIPTTSESTTSISSASSSSTTSSAPASSSSSSTATTTTTTVTSASPTREPEAQQSPSSASSSTSAAEAPAPHSAVTPTQASEAPVERPNVTPTTTTVRPPS